ncbi:MAG: type transporter [Flavipsychrobacter sp.]|nr:type transporter [Flavipsychrobacter sp.]
MTPDGKTINGTALEAEWDQVISSKRYALQVNFAELWRYRDLLLMFVKRDIVTVYKQTILGPAWFFIQPIMTALVFTFVFGNLAGISTGGVPQILFYLSSLTIWNYFSDTLNVTSKTFTENAGIFGKVYFPRLIMPLSKVLSGFFKFLIQFSLFLIVWLYYMFFVGNVAPTMWLITVPFLMLLMAAMGLGCGIIITSMTTKYRDLTFLVAFGVQLLMYASPVIYPVSSVPENYQFYLWLNPLTSVFEMFKVAFFGEGVADMGWLLYSSVFTLVLLAGGIIIFNNVESRFIDTV